ncbi:unnamed protein product [Amoebophrya sp. A25]|nr:unnamed protein product [Amoebophrya sp. A25]|eukprot:GSA25T00023203001.1
MMGGSGRSEEYIGLPQMESREDMKRVVDQTGQTPSSATAAFQGSSPGMLFLKFLLYHVPFFIFLTYLWAADVTLPGRCADGVYVLPLTMTAIEAMPWHRFLSPKSLQYVFPLRVALPVRLTIVYLAQMCHMHLLFGMYGAEHLTAEDVTRARNKAIGAANKSITHLRGRGTQTGLALIDDTEIKHGGRSTSRGDHKHLQREEEDHKDLDRSSSSSHEVQERIPFPGADPVPPSPLLKTMSVILPCAGEGEYAKKTAESVYNTWNHAKGDDPNDPHPTLQEIVVVDDGTQPKLAESFLTEDVQKKYRIKVVRNDHTVGLINAKKIGGDHASGDILTFFDCHVAPQGDWYEKFFESINENYKRIVVPSITALDVGTWTQQGNGGNGVAKCYLTFDADFKWFDSKDNYVPLLSGGLLSMSKKWWEETGGYDKHMEGWGGENIDQSLRTWLCGGEMVTIPEAKVAHMWRLGSDARTARHYSVPGNAVSKNRFRAAKAWMGGYAEKMENGQFHGYQGPPGWYGDLSNLLQIKKNNNCREFGWYLNRFRNVYIDGGLIPEKTFLIEVSNSDNLNGKKQCLRYKRGPGTSGDGNGEVGLRACDPKDDRQRFHVANFKQGLRAWNTDQCLVDRGSVHESHADPSVIKTTVCNIAGQDHSQVFVLDEKTNKLRITHGCWGGDGTKLDAANCESDKTVFTMLDMAEPIERQLFREQGYN